MPRDREAERERELERQRERERRWASGAVGVSELPGAWSSGKGHVMFFNTSTNDLGPTIVLAAALSLLAMVLWGSGRLSLVSYHGNIRTGTCTVRAKELQHIHIAAPGVDFWRAALNVSLMEDINSPQAPPTPPSPFKTCWSDGVAGPCEAPPAPKPPTYLATAYDNLRGSYSADKAGEQGLLDQHRVGTSHVCYFGYFPREGADVPELRVVFSVTKALHGGSVNGRTVGSNHQGLAVAPALAGCAAIIFCALVGLKLWLGRWRREVPVVEIALGNTRVLRGGAGWGEDGQIAGGGAGGGGGSLTWRNGFNGGAAVSYASTSSTLARTTPPE